MPGFRLQFPIERARDYAARYSYADDVEVVAIGRTARERGYYLFEEFAAVCRWKSQRTASYVARNARDSVEHATRIALDRSTSERERINALRTLHGVEWSTASVLLHLAGIQSSTGGRFRPWGSEGLPHTASASGRHMSAPGSPSWKRLALTDEPLTRHFGSGPRSAATACLSSVLQNKTIVRQAGYEATSPRRDARSTHPEPDRV
jgi:hypothetical protein